jgi:hypothetical protein
VTLHVGTHKTGTTFLQTLMWNNRDVLRRQGVLFPGRNWFDHVHASLKIRNSPTLHLRGKSAPSAWDRILQEIRAFDGTAVISHEDFGPASAEQAQSVLQALEPAETHVVVTARSCLWTLPGLWQSNVKFHSTAPLADFGSGRDDNPLNNWGWRSLDTAAVLARWAGTLPPERVHVITVPGKGAPRSQLWERYAGLLGIDPNSCDASVATSNDSLGVVEVELLRKVNTYLGPHYSTPRVAGRWLRSYLAGEVLAPRGGDRYGPDPEQEAFLRKKSVEIVETIREAGYDVIGDLDELLPPDGTSDWRHPDEVTPAELADAGAATIARVLDDLRHVTGQRNRLRARAERAEDEVQRWRQPSVRTRWRRAARRIPGLARAVSRVRQARASAAS